MKKLYTAHDPAEANIIRGMLASHGVRVEVRGEALWSARGIIPLTQETLPSVWVAEPDFDRAKDLLAATTKVADDAGPWTCPRCKEEVDAELGECWSCGAERPS